MTDELREILEDYKLWDDRVERKMRQIRRLRERMTSAEITYSDMPGGSEAYTMADYAADLDQLEQELRRIRSNREAAYDRIFRLLVRLRSGAQIDVIYRRYIMLQTWGQICRGRDAGRDAVTECHERAIKNLDNLLTPQG